MSRTIKFRVWHKNTLNNNGMPDKERMSPVSWTPSGLMAAGIRTEKVLDEDNFIFLQFTGLLDKNGVTEVYEGDIIDVEGNIIGNIYESPQIYEEGTYLTIEGMGTSAWRNTESTAMGFGLKYAE